MGLLGKLFGTPPQHAEEKDQSKIVEAPEFDVTQYAKKLALVVGVLAPAIAGVLKALKVEHVTSGMVIGAFGVTAAALLAVSLVMAVDVAARAYLTVSKPAATPTTKDGNPDARGGVLTASPGTVVWLKGDDEPHPVLAIAGDGKAVSSYLVATGSSVDRHSTGKKVAALEGAPEWCEAEKVQAVRSSKWP